MTKGMWDEFGHKEHQEGLPTSDRLICMETLYGFASLDPGTNCVDRLLAVMGQTMPEMSEPCSGQFYYFDFSRRSSFSANVP
jgi:hypothetical protein